MSKETRGRPPFAWLTVDQLAGLPVGTAVAIEASGNRHARRTTGRIVGANSESIDLDTPHGPVSVYRGSIGRARVIPALYAPGDPVLLRHIPAAAWRGGVVRTDGAQVLVEQLDGDFVWHAEDDIEPADARDPVTPRRQRVAS